MIRERNMAGGRVTLSTLPEGRRLFAKARYDRADRIVMIGSAVAAVFLLSGWIGGWL